MSDLLAVDPVAYGAYVAAWAFFAYGPQLVICMLFAWSACKRTHGDLLNWLIIGFLWSLLPVHRRDRHVVDVAPCVARGVGRGAGVVSDAPWVWCGAARLPVPRADAFEPPAALEPLADLRAAIGEALAAPLGAPRLRELARGARSVVVTVPDASRPCPSEPILLALLEELQAAGVPDAAVTVAIGCGLHATTGDEERARLAGPPVAARVEVVDAQGIESPTADLGVTSLGAPVRIARRVAAGGPRRDRRGGRAAPLRGLLRRGQRASPSAAPGARRSPGRTARRSSRSRASASRTCGTTRSRRRCVRSPPARRSPGA